MGRTLLLMLALEPRVFATEIVVWDLRTFQTVFEFEIKWIYDGEQAQKTGG